MLLQQLNYFDLMLHLDLEETIVSSCINCLQLHRRPKSQASLLNRQGHNRVWLNWEQFTRIKKRRTKFKYFFKIKIDWMYQWSNGFRHILRFMDIHIFILLWVKVLHLQTSGDKINLKNTENLYNYNIMKSCG